MAWFDDAGAGSKPQPVTMERIQQYFREIDCLFEMQKGTVVANVSGFACNVSTYQDEYMFIRAGYPNPDIGQERWGELWAWVQDRNVVGTIGTCKVTKVVDGELLAVISEHCYRIKFGATDAQLREWLRVGIEAQIHHMESFCKLFNFPRPLK
ncbi:hypothetical protein FRX94_03830 [Corynebacterium canis]|uniref:YbjN domain-containing protein n=1 Tax=Corynebacterium canis TaxID=679663 RepID=A0A5C5UNF4_9CORY|nr:hypothetical protein [Corynebacterium canis]TWT26980.1 hypothetical protein FRX94_03830 [Corynebacterium canis]WJY75611.1 hypothetical protein CCANI_08915 [Corynebacterium canis]